MKYAVQEFLQARDPNSGVRMDMWIVWAFEDGEGIYQMAYCSKPEYAEHIKRLLEAESEQQPDKAN